MVSRKKTKVSGASAPSRKPGALPRKHHMQTDMTAEEKRLVLAHCAKLGISVSQYLAELAVADATENLQQRQCEEEDEITFTIKIPRSKRTKLEIFAQRRGETIEDHVRELLLPRLEKQAIPFSLETESLRYYLDDSEHSLVMKQLKKRGLSARNYISFLAVQAVKNPPKSKK